MAAASTSSDVNPTKPLMLLSLDGGGIRGLSELCILETIMHRVKLAKKLTEDPLPADYFDMIGGTSTGGLVALLLGRLRLSVPEAIDIFARMSKEIFSEQKPKWSDGRFKATNLENAIKKVLKDLKCDENEKLLIPGSNTCRTFVCAVPAEHLTSPRLFRTYDARNPNYNPTIWEAGRATSAAPTFFKHIDIGGSIKERFVDGGLGCNNPSERVIKEAIDEFSSESNRQVACIVSIGTGMRKIIGFEAPTGYQKVIPKDLLKALAKIATETEKDATRMEERFRNCPGLFLRLNVDAGLETIELHTWEDLPKVKTHTTSYLEKFEISMKIDSIVEGLLGRSVKSYPLSHLGGTYQPEPAIPKSKVVSSTPNFRAAHFVSRKNILANMIKKFESPRSPLEPLLTVLFGMGGCGKSQLALEYCQKARDELSYTFVFWIDATTPETAMQSFSTFAKLLSKPEFNASDQEENLQFVRRELQSSTEKWLLVFDNYDDPTCFKDRKAKEYFPQSGCGSIIVTTRHRDARSLGLPLDISTMTSDEAIELLLRRSEVDQTEESRSKARDIVAKLGFHALAIDQAGAYIKKREMNDISFYLRDFDQRRSKVLSEAPAEWNYHKKLKDNPALETDLTVFTTWELSFNLLSGDTISRSDKETILTLIAFFDHKGISDTLFESYASQNPNWMPSCRERKIWDVGLLRDILSEMYSLSLLESFRIRDEDAIFSIHPLVQEWLRLRQGKENTRQYANEAILVLYKQANLERRGNYGQKTTFTQRQKILAHVDAILMNCVNFISQDEIYSDENLLQAMEAFAFLFGKEGWPERAANIQKLVTEGRENIFEKDDIKTLESTFYLANHLRNIGEYTKAETLSCALLKRSTRVLGKEAIKTLQIQRLLASIFNAQRKYPEAEEMLHENILILQKFHPKETYSMLQSMNSLALALQNQGKQSEAKPLYRDVLALLQKIFGKRHPDTLNAMSNLGMLLEDQGEISEAESILREVLDTTVRTLGSDHSDTLTSKLNLACLLRDRGELVEAESIFRDARPDLETKGGLKHPRTLNFLSHFADCLDKAGKKEESKGIWQQVDNLKKEIRDREAQQRAATTEEEEDTTEQVQVDDSNKDFQSSGTER